MTKPEQLAGVSSETVDGTVLVTGSTKGIGKEAALALGRLGADVIVHGRNRDRGERVRDTLTDEIGTDAVFYKADFADQTEVKELAEKVHNTADEMPLLVNNAGGLFGGVLAKTGATDAGIEYTFAVNHIAPFLLTYELFGLVEASSRARIVNVASVAHKGGKMNFDTIEDDSVRGFSAYNRSKLANILFTNELAERAEQMQSPVTTASIHPGNIPGSGFTRNLPNLVGSLGNFLNGSFGTDTPQDGAANILKAGLTDVTNGAYIRDLNEATPEAKARDRDTQEQLWIQSERLTGINWNNRDTN